MATVIVETNTVNVGTAVITTEGYCEFPECGILDDFNRTDRVLDGNWASWAGSHTMPNILNNQLIDNDDDYKADIYYTIGFVAPCQYYYDLVNPQLDYRYNLFLTTTDTWDDARLMAAVYDSGGNWHIHKPDYSYEDVGGDTVQAIGVDIQADNTVSIYIKRNNAWELIDTYNFLSDYGYDIGDYTNIEIFMYNGNEDAHIKIDNFGGCNL